MERLARLALIAELADRLKERGSWCGETHLQKASYFLQEALGVPLGFSFVLHKRGPYSFDLSAELASMRADRLLRMRPHQPPYGPSLDATETSEVLRTHSASSLAPAARAVGFIAEQVGSMTTSQLERYATAHYVMHREAPASSNEAQAERVHELKPHVTREQAAEALRWVTAMELAAARSGLTSEAQTGGRPDSASAAS